MTVDRDLLTFIREHLPSVWALELLLLLRRDGEQLWSADALVAELRASQALVSRVLADFERTGLVVAEADGRYRYAPAAKVLAELCDRLEAAYRQRPVAVINMISAPADRIQALADAFRLKGEGK